MNFLLVFLLYLPLVFSFSLGSLVSSALDFVPIVGNSKIFVGVPQFAKKVGKIKIANNFEKVGVSSMVKVSNIVKFVFKTVKIFFKLGKEENKDNEDM